MAFLMLSAFFGFVFQKAGLPWWLSSKESTCQCGGRRFDPWVGKIPWRRKWQASPVFLPGKSSVGDTGSIPGLGRSPGEGNGNTLQSSCLENPMDKGAWWATVHGVAKSQTRLSRHILSARERTHTPLGNPLFIYSVNTVLISHYMS